MHVTYVKMVKWGGGEWFKHQFRFWLIRGQPFDPEGGGGGGAGTFGRDRLFIFITGSAGKFISG